jgi:hypothetical protein
MIEIDLIVTSDNVIIAGHHWSHSKKILGYQGEDKLTEDPLSLSEFKSLKIHGKYTPLDINDINDIFEANADLILVTDKIRNHDLLLDQFKYHDRLIVECFGLESCLEGINKGINNMAFNIRIDNTRVVEDFILNYSSIVPMVTFNAGKIKNDSASMDNAKKLLEKGTINLVYSSNEDEFIKEQIGVSVSAFYTDFWSLKSQSCISNPERCITY